MKFQIFNALIDLYNEGITSVDNSMAEKVIEAAKHALPEFVVCGGIYEAETNTKVLYVDNYIQAKK